MNPDGLPSVLIITASAEWAVSLETELIEWARDAGFHLEVETELSYAKLFIDGQLDIELLKRYTVIASSYNVIRYDSKSRRSEVVPLRRLGYLSHTGPRIRLVQFGKTHPNTSHDSVSTIADRVMKLVNQALGTKYKRNKTRNV